MTGPQPNSLTVSNPWPNQPAFQKRVLLGRSTGAFGFASWLVLCTAFVALVYLFIYPEASTIALEVLFPIWALVLAVWVKDNLAAPVRGFSIVYLMWMWVGSVTLLPPSNLPTTLLDPIPPSQWLLYLLGFVGYMGGVLLLGQPRQSPNIMLGYRPRWDERRFWLLLIVAMTATFIAWLIITLQEGIPLFSPNVEELRASLPTRHHMLFQIQVAGANFLLPLLFAYRWSMRPRKLVSAVLWLLSLVDAFILISGGNRGTIIPPLLTILILRHFLIRPWRLSRVAPVAVCALILTGMSGYYRSLQYFGESFISTQVDLGVPPALQPFVSIYFSIRAPLTTFRDVRTMIPKIVPYQLGGLTFGSVMQLLPGRHPSSDYFFKDVLGHEFTGFGEPASMLGTFYADFGMAGVLICMAGIGVMASWLYGSMLKEVRLHWLLVYAYILQKLISGIYGSLFEYVVEILLPVSWFFTLKYFAQPPVARRVVPVLQRPDVSSDVNVAEP